MAHLQILQLAKVQLGVSGEVVCISNHRISAHAPSHNKYNNSVDQTTAKQRRGSDLWSNPLKVRVFVLTRWAESCTEQISWSKCCMDVPHQSSGAYYASNTRSLRGLVCYAANKAWALFWVSSVSILQGQTILGMCLNITKITLCTVPSLAREDMAKSSKQQICAMERQ